MGLLSQPMKTAFFMRSIADIYSELDYQYYEEQMINRDDPDRGTAGTWAEDRASLKYLGVMLPLKVVAWFMVCIDRYFWLNIYVVYFFFFPPSGTLRTFGEV